MAAKQQFLDTYEEEHAKTMRVLRAYPKDKLELRPHPKCKTARELAWVFALERGLGAMVLNGQFGKAPPGPMPPPPASWDELLAALEKGHKDFGNLVRSLPDAKLNDMVTFMTGPKQMGDMHGMEFCWFLLHDQIHHRGQFSVYLRMADAKLPSIYGPTADEPWM